MDIQTIKSIYLDHYHAEGYEPHSSSSLVHERLPTSFVMSVGLLQLEPILTGNNHNVWHDFTLVQRCIRHNDIELVGNESHLTFFEMAGAISAGTKSAKEVLGLFLELLLNKFEIDQGRLVFTVFNGGRFGSETLSPDEESRKALIDNGIDQDRIMGMGLEQNYFGLNNREQYTGPSVETFFDRGRDSAHPQHHCLPGCPCGRYIEIGNTVLLRYQKIVNKLKPLRNIYVESALGVERTAQALLNKKSIYDLSEIAETSEAIKESMESFGKDIITENRTHTAVDHLRAICFVVADGALPGHGGRRYVLRKLIRRFLVRVDDLGPKFANCLPEWLNVLESSNSHIATINPDTKSRIMNVILKEREIFNSGCADREKYLAGADNEDITSGTVKK